MIKFQPKSEYCYEVLFSHAKIGDAMREIDCYFVFYPVQNGGAWSAWILRKIADKLDELNEGWNKQINDYFDEQEKKGNIPFESESI